MYWINRYKFVDKKTKNIFEIYSRTEEFANNLVRRINDLGLFCLVKARFHFCKKLDTEIAPYSIEIEQEEVVTNWENCSHNATRI